jgi:hypothetical protein
MGDARDCSDYSITDEFDINLQGEIKTGIEMWYHVAFVYGGTNTFIYVNGFLSNSRSSLVDYSKMSTSRMQNYFGGSSKRKEWSSVHLDEIKIYNKVLTAEQIQIDMTTTGIPVFGKC